MFEFLVYWRLSGIGTENHYVACRYHPKLPEAMQGGGGKKAGGILLPEWKTEQVLGCFCGPEIPEQVSVGRHVLYFRCTRKMQAPEQRLKHINVNTSDVARYNACRTRISVLQSRAKISERV